MTKGKTQDKNIPSDAGQHFKGAKEKRQYVCTWIDSVTEQPCNKSFNEGGHLKVSHHYLSNFIIMVL